MFLEKPDSDLDEATDRREKEGRVREKAKEKAGKAMEKEDRWSRSDYLPERWMFKYSHSNKSTRVDIINQSGDVWKLKSEILLNINICR